MATDRVGVRPTRRCLNDLEAALPDLGISLTEISHPVVSSAQALPEQRDAGGAERVVSLADRVWFKVKTSDHRAVATELPLSEVSDSVPASAGTWWIGAAGRRQSDSPQRDFYAALQRECTSGKTVSTDHLTPTEWDWQRLIAEQGVAWQGEMKRLIIRLIIMSLKSGHMAAAEFRRHRIKALVRAENGHEAYLAITAEGIPDPQIFALLLNAVPGIDPDDWQPEPSPVAEMSPVPGEIIWSTLFPSDIASAVLDLDDD